MAEPFTHLPYPLPYCFNPDFAVEIVMRVESPIKTGVPARFFFESVAAPTVRRKIEEIPVFAGISARNRFSIANSGFNAAKAIKIKVRGQYPGRLSFILSS
jgi:hypothetical protein